MRIYQMDLGKFQLFLVTFCALEQMCVGVSFRMEEDGGLSAEWQDPSVDSGLKDAVDALVKRSKALRFYGLMGKRSGGDGKPKEDRRKKGEMFVGLMGRSVSDSLPRIRPSAAEFDVLEKSHKQGPEDDWVQIIY